MSFKIKDVRCFRFFFVPYEDQDQLDFSTGADNSAAKKGVRPDNAHLLGDWDKEKMYKMYYNFAEGCFVSDVDINVLLDVKARQAYPNTEDPMWKFWFNAGNCELQRLSKKKEYNSVKCNADDDCVLARESKPDTCRSKFFHSIKPQG